VGVALAAAALAAFAGWLLEALVGHAHKVVPFILWSVLRSHGIDKADNGKQLMFSDLYVHAWAGVAYGTVTAGIAALCVGLGASMSMATAVSAYLFMATGAVLAINLSAIPLARLHRRSSPLGEVPSALGHRGAARVRVMAGRSAGVSRDYATMLSLAALVLAVAGVAMGTWAVVSIDHRGPTTLTEATPRLRRPWWPAARPRRST
jgi:hypothetical protein